MAMDTISTMVLSWWLVSTAAIAGLMLVGLIAAPLWRRERNAAAAKAEALRNKALEEAFWERRL